MRKHALLTTGIWLTITTLAIGLPVRHVVRRHADQTALEATSRNVRLIGATVAAVLKTAVHESQVVLDSKSPDELFGKSAELISVGILEWHGENFSHVKRFDNQTFFKARKFDTKQVSELLSLFANDIANVGPSQEQIYTGMLGNEAPVLVVVSPLPGNPAPQSSVTVVDATRLLDVVGHESKQFQAFAVDRFGTLILHPDHDRAVNRESLVANPLVKALLASGQHEQTRTYDGFYGSATRLDVGGLLVVVQTPVSEANGFIREVGVVTALAGSLAMVTILTIMYLSARVRRRKAVDANGQYELKLAS